MAYSIQKPAVVASAAALLLEARPGPLDRILEDANTRSPWCKSHLSSLPLASLEQQQVPQRPHLLLSEVDDK